MTDSDPKDAEIEQLREVCREWLPIIEHQFERLPPAPESLGWQVALHRIERLRKAAWPT